LSSTSVLSIHFHFDWRVDHDQRAGRERLTRNEAWTRRAETGGKQRQDFAHGRRLGGADEGEVVGVGHGRSFVSNDVMFTLYMIPMSRWPPPFCRRSAGASIIDAERGETWALPNPCMAFPVWPRAPKKAPVPPTIAKFCLPAGGPARMSTLCVAHVFAGMAFAARLCALCSRPAAARALHVEQ
jgi:hypothetical protein